MHTRKKEKTDIYIVILYPFDLFYWNEFNDYWIWIW